MDSKKATTLSEQIALLRRRGMTIDDESKAKEVLLDIGYYRLGFYWFPYEKAHPQKGLRTHEFRKGARFDHVVKLYYFDFNLRNMLMKYLNRIEINFKTFLTYHVSTLYPDSPTWFADPAIVSREYIQEFDKIVYTDKFKKSYPAIKRHHQIHKNDRYAPAWKTIEYMTFGAVIHLFHALLDQSTRMAICRHFGIRQQKIFDSYMKVVLLIRNYCAHGNILYDLALPTSFTKGPASFKKRSDGQIENVMKEVDYQNLGGALRVILYMIGCVSKNRQQDMKEELRELFKREVDIRDILNQATGIKDIDDFLKG